MTTKEYYLKRAELYVNDLWEYYGVQRDADGLRYVISIPSKKDYLEGFHSDLEEFMEEVDDFDELTREEDMVLESEAALVVAEAYDKVVEVREKFLKE